MKRYLRRSCIFLFLATIVLLTGCIPSTKNGPSLDYKRELILLSTRAKVPGRFFLATGRIETEQVYIFVEKGSDGFSAMKIIPISYGVYIEDIQSGETPYVEHFFCNGPMWYPCWHENGVPETLAENDSGSFDNYYIFHIPEGTVTNYYNLGLDSEVPQE